MDAVRRITQAAPAQRPVSAAERFAAARLIKLHKYTDN
jgi:hypothetical protein